MNYLYTKKVREDDALRESFNELTERTFGFNFKAWYEAGYWTDAYMPHVLVDNGKVVANVSVNCMDFAINGEIKHFLQIGTVMTDEKYRGKGLGRYIMEQIMKEYHGKVDGMYLFGNDSVLNYYPKFGFVPSKEYAYEKKAVELSAVQAYELKKINCEDKKERAAFYAVVDGWNNDDTTIVENTNDGFCMCHNTGLYFFWVLAGFGENVYYIPETESYVIADTDGDCVNVHQIFGNQTTSVERIAKALNHETERIVLWYTPVNKEGYEVTEFKEDDCTLFVMGEALERVEKEKIHFPELSHA